jgi:hypothetical protein
LAVLSALYLVIGRDEEEKEGGHEKKMKKMEMNKFNSRERKIR